MGYRTADLGVITCSLSFISNLKAIVKHHISQFRIGQLSRVDIWGVLLKDCGVISTRHDIGHENSIRFETWEWNNLSGQLMMSTQLGSAPNNGRVGDPGWSRCHHRPKENEYARRIARCWTPVDHIYMISRFYSRVMHNLVLLEDVAIKFWGSSKPYQWRRTSPHSPIPFHSTGTLRENHPQSLKSLHVVEDHQAFHPESWRQSGSSVVNRLLERSFELKFGGQTQHRSNHAFKAQSNQSFSPKAITCLISKFHPSHSGTNIICWNWCCAASQTFEEERIHGWMAIDCLPEAWFKMKFEDISIWFVKISLRMISCVLDEKVA